MPRPGTFPKIDANGTNVVTPSTQIQDDGLPEKALFANGIWNWVFHWLHAWVVWLDSTAGQSARVLVYNGAAAGVGAGSTDEEECANFYDLPATTLVVGTVLKVQAVFDITNISSGNVTLRLRFGPSATAIASRNLMVSVVSTAVADDGILSAEFRVSSIGTILASGFTTSAMDTSGTTTAVHFQALNAENDTVINRISASVQFSVSNGSHNVDCLSLAVEVINPNTAI